MPQQTPAAGICLRRLESEPAGRWQSAEKTLRLPATASLSSPITCNRRDSSGGTLWADTLMRFAQSMTAACTPAWLLCHSCVQSISGPRGCLPSYARAGSLTGRLPAPRDRWPVSTSTGSGPFCLRPCALLPVLPCRRQGRAGCLLQVTARPWEILLQRRWRTTL